MGIPEPVDIGSLGRIIRALQDHLKDSARQGADEQTALDSQFIGIGEEAGEALGAYRRWRGFARRAGTSAEVYDELADVLIVTMVSIIHYAEVQGHILGTGDGTVIEEVLARKLNKIFSRGWVNKDAPEYGGLGRVNKDAPDYGGLTEAEYKQCIAEHLRTQRIEHLQSITPTPEYGGPTEPVASTTIQSITNPAPQPDGVYLKTDQGWTLIGPADNPETWTKVAPPYIVVLGRNL